MQSMKLMYVFFFSAALFDWTYKKKAKYAPSVGSSTGFYSVPPSIMKDHMSIAPSGHYVTTYANNDDFKVSLTTKENVFVIIFYPSFLSS